MRPPLVPFSYRPQDNVFTDGLRGPAADRDLNKGHLIGASETEFILFRRQGGRFDFRQVLRFWHLIGHEFGPAHQNIALGAFFERCAQMVSPAILEWDD